VDQVEVVFWEAPWLFEVVDEELGICRSIRLSDIGILDLEMTEIPLRSEVPFGCSALLNTGRRMLISGSTNQLGCTGLRSIPVTSIQSQLLPSSASYAQ